MANKKKQIKPLLEKCPQCLAEPGIKCTEQGFVLEAVHMSRYAVAQLRQTAPPRAPNTSVLMVRCPRCGAMPRRICTGPPPLRDPKPYHKERWLEKEKVDNARRKALGLQPTSIGKPWLENREAPEAKPASWRDLQAYREEKQARKQDE